MYSSRRRELISGTCVRACVYVLCVGACVGMAMDNAVIPKNVYCLFKGKCSESCINVRNFVLLCIIYIGLYFPPNPQNKWCFMLINGYLL